MNTQAKPPAIVQFKNQLDARADQFRAALPAHIPPERFQRVVLTAVQNNPDLMHADRQTLWNSCMRAAQDGLLPDGREGAIVIFNTKEKYKNDAGEQKERWIKKAQWMPMVYGIMKKARNSGQIATIAARVVFEGDTYRFWIDEEGEHILYEPSETADRSKMRLVFAMARTKDGELFVEPMTRADVEKVRAVSRAKDSGPWVDWFEEMAKKTAIRRLAKRLPASSDLDDLIRRDDELYNLDRKTAAPGVLDLDDMPDNRAELPSPPSAGVSESADASPADDARGPDAAPLSDRGGPISERVPDREPTELEQSVAGHLIDCRNAADCDGVLDLFRLEFEASTAPAQDAITAMIKSRKAAIALLREAAQDTLNETANDFPGDRKP